MMEGAKMSKSFGNIIPLREGLAKFGADPVRLSVMSTAELLQDAEFSPSIAKSMLDRLERLYRFTSEVTKTQHKRRKVSEKSLKATDRWMLSRLQGYIREATEAMGKLAVRKAIHSMLYELDQDLQWYQRRNVDQKAKRKDLMNYVFNEVLNAQIRMLAPVAPHMCEELWEMIGGKGFVSLGSWPVPDESRIDVGAEESEALVVGVVEDTQNIIKATGVKPEMICYYVAAPWKWQVFVKALKESVSSKLSQRDLMKELMKDPALRASAEKVAKFVAQIVDELNRMPEERKQRLMQTEIIRENEVLGEARRFFEKEFGVEISVYLEEDSKRYDPKGRAQLAKPYRPAIFIE
jgi:leucyl-tRNA synthetase